MKPLNFVTFIIGMLIGHLTYNYGNYQKVDLLIIISSAIVAFLIAYDIGKTIGRGDK